MLRNFPTADELRAHVSQHAASIEVIELAYYWLLAYELPTGDFR